MGIFVTPSYGQNTSESDSNIPLNVTNPQNKQDFIQQCSQNLQAQGKTASDANAYCGCSADAVYQYLSQNSGDISSEGAVLEKILQCRVKYIPND
ncbi:MAG: hypothetical protein D6822_02140 [Cyanobacteria bacterium J149]|nr:MAG: hypothetical protein D6822_02140 [Cyanobacteria bacterium J149]